MAYTLCPNCGLDDSGRSLHLCNDCGFVGCFKSGGITGNPDGCYASSRCPGCGKHNSSKQVDRL